MEDIGDDCLPIIENFTGQGPQLGVSRFFAQMADPREAGKESGN